MAEQNTPDYPPMMELERELTRKERQIEYLQTELRRYHNLMEELKQGMRPIGTIEEVKGDMALVRLSGGQAFQVRIPGGKVTKSLLRRRHWSRKGTAQLTASGRVDT